VLIVEPGSFRTRLLGGSLRPMPEIEAYRATVGATRAYVSREDGAQRGDPAKAARFIADAVSADTAPLRLPLGGDAVDAIRAKLESVAADVTRSEAVARATTFDG
jgi:hypothetical protein